MPHGRAGRLAGSRVLVHEGRCGGPHLKRIQVEGSLRCNLQCSYCYSSSGPGRRTALNGDEIRDLVRLAHEMGVLTRLHCGEFFLDSKWESYRMRMVASSIAGDPLSPDLVQHHPGSNREVERLGRSVHRDGESDRSASQVFFSEPGALTAHEYGQAGR